MEDLEQVGLIDPFTLCGEMKGLNKSGGIDLDKEIVYPETHF